MKLLEPRREVFLVENDEHLKSALSFLDTSESLGIDAERASGFRYGSSAYLVQFATKEKIILIDPTKIREELPRLSTLVNNKRWILHSATQDLPCLAEIGMRPKELFDTELAARLCGIERFGLSSIVQELLDLEMEKEHSAADWSVRPIPQPMLVYAALDVDVLHELEVALSSKLEELNRTAWAAQEFERLLGFQPKPQKADAWRSLPGITKIKDETKLKIAASLHSAREEIARTEDIAPGRLIPDRSIMAVVDQMPTTKKELASNKLFQGRASRSKLDTWWRAIEESARYEISEPETDEDHMPNHRSWERRFPEAHARLLVLRPLVAELAQQLGIATEILLTPEYLRRVAFSPESSVEDQLSKLGARPWQIALVAEPIKECLSALSD